MKILENSSDNILEEKEVLETIAKLKEKNRKLKARLNKNKQKPIKTTKK